MDLRRLIGILGHAYGLERDLAVVHRALACIGDAAVPAIIQSAREEGADFYDIWHALNEIGVEVPSRYELQETDLVAIEQRWKENREDSLEWRTVTRKMIGLPPPNLFNINGKRRR